ncbi:MAG: S-layer homology domain-containing protein [Bacillota bacterium]|nr:S-layer homology domain-containing protein [Bacillota bacterium]
MKMRTFRLTIEMFLFLAIIITNSFGYITAAQENGTSIFSDVNDKFWAKQAINNWSSKGVINGDGVNFYPDKQITRAELAAILYRIFGYEKTTDNPFSDIKNNDWYYDFINKAYTRGIIKGDLDNSGNLLARPNDPVTRAEAALIFKRIFSVNENSGDHTSFKDTNLPEWAKDAIFGMEASGYINGKDGGFFDPFCNLSRAETVQILNNIIRLYINEPGNYSTNSDGNVVINTPDAVLQNMKITGNLYLSEGIGEGSVSLVNVTVTGSTFIRGGGADRITITNSNLGNKVIEKDGINLNDSSSSSGSNSSGASTGSSGSGGSGNTDNSDNAGSSGDITEY